MVFLEQFDAASPAECYKRCESVTPQQALALAQQPADPAQSCIRPASCRPVTPTI